LELLQFSESGRATQVHPILQQNISYTHSLTHSLIHLRTHPLTHSLTHSHTHSLIHSFTHSLTYSLTRFRVSFYVFAPILCEKFFGLCDLLFNFAIYIIIMASYAFNHFNIKRKELYWNKASDNEVLLEVANIIQKFDNSINDNYILNFHPECALQNYDEILSMIVVVRDKNGIIVDDLHKTIPYLTKYERARILGQRAKQINSGSLPFVKVPENVIDGYIIAELELKEKKIPFIIRRPLPNGGSEYWSIKDLEDILF
jgi:DNA-directed RNA polymerase I, II, and III subunit RPABC2